MRNVIVIFVVMTCGAWAACASRAAGQATQATQVTRAGGLPSRDELLVLAQAADVVGQTLSEALAAREPLARPGAGYHEVVERVAAEVRRAGEAGVDATLRNLTDRQLLDEVMALQSYNQRAFVRLQQAAPRGLRAMATPIASASASASTPATAAAAADPLRGGATTRPADALMNAAVARVKRREAASPQWERARRSLREAVAARATYGSWTRQEAPGAGAGTGGAEQAVQMRYEVGGAPAGAAAAAADDPRWRPHFYGPGDELSGWDVAFGSDPYAFRPGGGYYQRQDTRVNQYFDTRLDGLPDRRVNIDFDRRRNVHIDPRENF